MVWNLDLNGLFAAGVSWPVLLGQIEEDLAALSRGDSGVNSRLWITADPADLVFEKNGTAAKARLTASITGGVENLWLASNASQNAGGGAWNRDDTAKVAWAGGINASGDSWDWKRAAAAANPITF